MDITEEEGFKKHRSGRLIVQQTKEKDTTASVTDEEEAAVGAECGRGDLSQWQSLMGPIGINTLRRNVDDFQCVFLLGRPVCQKL